MLVPAEQGHEAGGHTGEVSTMVLVPLAAKTNVRAKTLWPSRPCSAACDSTSAPVASAVVAILRVSPSFSAFRNPLA